MHAPLRIIIDSREQRPWYFPPEAGVVRVEKLDAGDYALEGDSFSIERKSLDDFIGTISSGWARFLREINRMVLPKVVIVEGRYLDIVFYERDGNIEGPRHGHHKISPQFIAKRIAELTHMNVSVLFCENAEIAAAQAWHLLKERNRQVNE